MDKLWFRARRMISVLLVFAMLASITPVQVFAEEATTEPSVQTTEPAPTEEPAAEPVVEETPAEEPVVEETPAVEEPVVEETPAVETPVVEETPAVETPVVEETPAAEAPVVEETPAVETPAVEESAPEATPAVEEPAAEETPAEEAPVLVSYTVKYLDKATEAAIYEETAGEAAVGETIAIEAPEVEGYTLCADQPTELVLAADAENVATVYFEAAEVAMPAQTLTATAADGATVTIDAPEGALPAGTTVQITIMDTVPEVEGVEFTQAVAYDVTLWNNGEEVQPAVAVSVKMSNVPLAAQTDSLEAYHLADDGSVDKGNVQADKSADFSLNSFSPIAFYGTVEGGETEADEPAEETADAPEVAALNDNGSERKGADHDEYINLYVDESYTIYDWYADSCQVIRGDIQLQKAGHSSWRVTGKTPGEAVVRVRRSGGLFPFNWSETVDYHFTVQERDTSGSTQTVYVYVKTEGDKPAGVEENGSGWYTIGKIEVEGLPNINTQTAEVNIYEQYSSQITAALSNTLERYSPNASIDISNTRWSVLKKVTNGADDYVDGGNTWHLDGYITVTVKDYVTITYTDGVDDEVVFPDEEHTVLKGSETPKYNDGVNPTREGWIFAGWDPDPTDFAEETVTYTAQWEEEAPELVTITYQVGNGGGGTLSSYTESVAVGGNAVGSIATANDGYYFVNWVDANGYEVSTEEKFAPTGVMEAATYTAIFARKTDLTITIADKTAVYTGSEQSGYGYETSGDGISVITGTLQDGHYIDSVTGYTPAKGTKVNEYTGVATNAQVVVKDAEGNDVSDQYNVTVNPGKLTIKGKVTYNWNTTDTVTIDGEAAQLPTNNGEYALNEPVSAYSYGDPDKQPTRTGYTFKGWADTADATTAVDTAPMGETGLTFYAVWEADDVKVNITYYLDEVEEDDLAPSADFPDKVTGKKYGDELTIHIGTSGKDVNVREEFKYVGHYVIDRIVYNGEEIFELTKANYESLAFETSKTLSGDANIQIYYASDAGYMEDGIPDKYQVVAVFHISPTNAGTWQSHGGNTYASEPKTVEVDGQWSTSANVEFFVGPGEVDTVVPAGGYTESVTWEINKQSIDTPVGYRMTIGGGTQGGNRYDFYAAPVKATSTVTYNVEHVTAKVTSKSGNTWNGNEGKIDYQCNATIEFRAEKGYAIDFDKLEEAVTTKPATNTKKCFQVKTDSKTGEKYALFNVYMSVDNLGEYVINLVATPDPEQQYTVTYNAEANGSVSVKSETAQVLGIEGIEGSVAVPALGYYFDGWYKDGTKISSEAVLTPEVIQKNLNTSDGLYTDTTFTARFAVQNNLSYTVRYLEDGTARELASPKTVGGQTLGATVTETAIDIGGYTLTSDKNPQSITIGTGENVITFYYREVGPDVEPTPTPTETPTVPVTPPTTTTPTTPAGGGTTTTTTTEEEEVTEEPAEEEVIEEEETPLVEEPAEEETIGEEETPLAGGNAAWALLNLILAILTVLGSAVLLIGYLGKKRKEDEEGEEEYTVKKNGFWRVISLIPAIAAVVAFILTEDMSQPMAFVDRWTLLMVIIAVIQIVVAVLSMKEKQEPEEE